MFRKITVNEKKSCAVVRLLEGESQPSTWITVMVGQNGVRKSYVLRALLDVALGQSGARTGGRLIEVEGGGRPSCVVCLSGTPLDRFPRASSNSFFGVLKESLGVPLLYFGARATNGMAGTAQSERALIAALLNNIEAVRQRGHLLERVFSHLGLRARMDIRLKLSKATADDHKLWLNTPIDKQHMVREDVEKRASQLLARFAEAQSARGWDETVERAYGRFMALDYLVIYKLLTGINKSHALPVLTLLDGELSVAPSYWDAYGWGVGEWLVLLKAGFLDTAGTSFFRLTDVAENSGDEEKDEALKLKGQDLSSGQWGWLAGFAGLCAELRPGSLVLVDEPENSLHPKWQQQYTSMLNSIFRECGEVQAVIATHSPLVASGVDPEWGSVVALRSGMSLDDGVLEIRSEAMESTFGWSASDVYENIFGIDSTRAPGFTATADIALSLIREKKPVTQREIEVIRKELSEGRETLPMHDPMRNVITSILQRFSGQQES
ncbi:hypothetical protein DA83_19440 [Pseudomonas sp. 250J]|uniref:AAA family ATPase n=1 Tax=Pseudomonas peradeniyensis TaxID=2745488 RepID=A0ABT2VHV1_9PSED|nr:MULTISPECIES: AAA family ATPase [Pseudomonas]KNX78945.1 hypothetical protein DA83_19440 [Pseudomonas sp. 250J]MCU7240957.1 AAA family ATPase [Pseudomonas peradeniyensis]MCU7282818.1 AAA family ATPase [Pseudomonas peradeniyensis]QZA53075.1 AAA family ATPase [Pseudomonas sp. 2hn]